jgi:hypothetical protein
MKIRKPKTTTNWDRLPGSPNVIKYRDGYKYQLGETYSLLVAVTPIKDIRTDFISLTTHGLLTIQWGYAWDGPSGPTRDTKTFMRGSLVHDALNDLMRNGYLRVDEWRYVVDNELYRICREDGMSWIRAQYAWLGVRIGGYPSANPLNKKEVLTAP